MIKKSQIPFTKKIKGKRYYYLFSYNRKSNAIKEANKRRKPGYSVRVIKGIGEGKGLYHLYTSPMWQKR